MTPQEAFEILESRLETGDHKGHQALEQAITELKQIEDLKKQQQTLRDALEEIITIATTALDY